MVHAVLCVPLQSAQSKREPRSGGPADHVRMRPPPAASTLRHGMAPAGRRGERKSHDPLTHRSRTGAGLEDLKKRELIVHMSIRPEEYSSEELRLDTCSRFTARRSSRNYIPRRRGPRRIRESRSKTQHAPRAAARAPDTTDVRRESTWLRAAVTKAYTRARPGATVCRCGER